jgi:Glutaredoxin
MMEAETPKTVIYGKPNCRFCDEAKKAFTSVELPYEYEDLAEALALPDAMGEPRKVPEDWRTNGMIDLMANWALANCPTPLIVVDGRGHPNLASALTAVGYRDRKRAVMQRKKESGEADTRTQS